MANQSFQIVSESPAAGDLMFWSIVGHEALSRPSVYELTVLSRNDNIDAKDILGRPFDVVMKFFDKSADEHERHCHGFAVRFVRMNRVGRFHEYRITLRSWFWLLTHRINSHILQEVKVTDVMNKVFDDSPISGHKKTEERLSGTHDTRSYCVQYMESDFNFLSRLMEDEGIYYWFDTHTKPGTMYLADNSSSAHDALVATDVLKWAATATGADARFNEVTRWTSSRRLDSGKYAARDSDFKAITKKLGANIDVSDDHELANFEVFEFPGGYFNSSAAENLARTRGDELIALRDRHWAVTRWPDVAAGHRFKLEGDEDGGRDGEYLIAGCTFAVTHPGYEGSNHRAEPIDAMNYLARAIGDDAIDAHTMDLLHESMRSAPALATGGVGTSAFVLTVLPAEVPFRPARTTPKKVMPGPQSAIVVGAAGKEIDADQYGRVKVHFHWDRYDQSDEKSSCWVRVSQPWAGKGWGGYFIPRIGQEVIVDFLNGDPDRPLVTGRVYNSEQIIPWGTNHTQSGFLSRSTPGGSSANANAFRFEDKKGSEQIWIHAEKNQDIEVENDETRWVGHDQTETVDHDQTIHVKHDRTVNVVNDETKGVEQNQKLTVGGKQDNLVVKDQTTNVNGSRALHVTKKHTITDMERLDVTDHDEKRKIGGNQTVTVGGALSYKASKMSFAAGHIDFSVTGANSIVWAADAAPYTASFMKYTLTSNTDLSLLAVGNINQTSLGSNTTVLGSNTSGYIGSSAAANLGMSRSTFLGLSMSNAVGLAINNFLGLQMENTAALRLVTVAALGIEQKAGDLKQAAFFIKSPGAGAAPAAAAASVGPVGVGLALASVIAGIASAVKDVRATFKQYEEAAAELEQAANSPSASRVPGLSARLKRMAQLARNRADQGRSLVGAHYGTDTAIGAGAGATLGLLGGPASFITVPIGAAAGLVAGGPGGAIIRTATDSTSSDVEALQQREDGTIPLTPEDQAQASLPSDSDLPPGTPDGSPGNTNPGSSGGSGTP